MNRMDRLKTTFGILTGILLGLANGLGFKSIMVGLIVTICSAILFAFIFNKVSLKNK